MQSGITIRVNRSQIVANIKEIAQNLPLDRLEKLWRIAHNVKNETYDDAQHTIRSEHAQVRQREVEMLEDAGLSTEAARSAREP